MKMAKIGPVDCEMIGPTEIVKNKNQRQDSPPVPLSQD